MVRAKKVMAKSPWKISIKKLTKAQLRQLTRMRRGGRGFGMYHCVDNKQSVFAGCTEGGAGTITTS